MKITIKQLKQLIKEQVEESGHETSSRKSYRLAEQMLKQFEERARSFLQESQKFIGGPTTSKGRLIQTLDKVLKEFDESQSKELKTFEESYRVNAKTPSGRKAARVPSKDEVEQAFRRRDAGDHDSLIGRLYAYIEQLETDAENQKYDAMGEDR